MSPILDLRVGCIDRIGLILTGVIVIGLTSTELRTGDSATEPLDSLSFTSLEKSSSKALKDRSDGSVLGELFGTTDGGISEIWSVGPRSRASASGYIVNTGPVAGESQFKYLMRVPSPRRSSTSALAMDSAPKLQSETLLELGRAATGLCVGDRLTTT